MAEIVQAVANSGEKIAAARALEAEHAGTSLFVDRMAKYLAGEKAMTEARARKAASGGPAMTNVTVRTKFFDDFIEAAVADSDGPESSIRQVVMLGAGMDTRAWRMPCLNRPELTVFEVDLGPVLDLKRERVALFFETETDTDGLKLQCSRRTVAADLSTPAWAPALKKAGFRTTDSSLWILEGLLYYFEEDEVSMLMLSILPLLAPGSVAIASVVGKERKATAKPRKSKGGLTAHFKWRCPDPVKFFQSVGFKVSSSVALGSARANYGRWDREEEGSVSYVAMQSARDSVRREFAQDGDGVRGDVEAPSEQELAKRMPKVLSEQLVAPEHCGMDSVFDGSMIVQVEESSSNNSVDSDESNDETSNIRDERVQDVVDDRQPREETPVKPNISAHRHSDTYWVQRANFPKCLRFVLKGYRGNGHPLLAGSHPMLGENDESKAMPYQAFRPNGSYVWDIVLPGDFTTESFTYAFIAKLAEGVYDRDGKSRRSVDFKDEKVKVIFNSWTSP